MKEEKWRKSALTDLLAGFVIAGVIGVILFPVFSRARSAPSSECQGNLKRLARALRLYEGDYDYLPPAHYDPDYHMTFPWSIILDPYMRKSALRCPDDEIGPVSYGYNRHLINHRRACWDDNSPEVESQAEFWPVSLDLVPHPKVTVALCEWAPNDGSAIPGDVESRTDHSTSSFRHDGGANYAFADGHVEWLTPDEVKGKTNGAMPVLDDEGRRALYTNPCDCCVWLFKEPWVYLNEPWPEPAGEPAEKEDVLGYGSPTDPPGTWPAFRPWVETIWQALVELTEKGGQESGETY